jgi:UDP-N-acetylmuramoylalanine--D-glutamate ligase
MNLENKKITVLGGLRSGVASAVLIKKQGGVPFVSDMGSSAKLFESVKELEKEKIEFETGVHSERVFDCDFIVVSPGVPSDSPVILSAKEKGIAVISELEFASRFCNGSIIAITGTNGKTTTTTLTGYLFNRCGLTAYLAGNIGSAFAGIAPGVKPEEFVALETSSFQLDFIAEFKPKIAAILNITPDHLNRYENKYENYINAKYKIFANQDENDYLILNADSEHTAKTIPGIKAKIIYFSLEKEFDDGVYKKGEEIIYKENGEVKFSCPVSALSLRGEHNMANCMAVIAFAKICGADNQGIIEALGSFAGVEHRLEFVREIEGVKYINDSKATNVDSVWYALRSFSEPLFLILGGLDKGNDYNQIKQLVVDKAKKVYAIGKSADKVFNFFHTDVKVEIKNSLEECVISANQEAREGDVVLLSPACASFDMFDSYEHRGDVFKEAVKKL